MLLLGIDLGTSSIKVSVVDGTTQQTLASAQYPDTESPIIAKEPGWAEQSPATWWQDVQNAILKLNSSGKYNPKDIGAIGIDYQMHGLVCLDKKERLLRQAIIWCDSRAVKIGEKAFKKIGYDKSLSRLLNSPGNFTASKLAWVKENEPEIYEKVDKVMSPGDFIALQLTGELTTSVSALSEGIFWDFKKNKLSKDVFEYFGFDKNIIPTIQPVFSSHGKLKKDIAEALSLSAGIPVAYKAGDQPNNALSLNVFEPGEVAAVAGTSGVIYGVSDQLNYDKQSRINSFAHVNHTEENPRIGVLLCINGAGITNRWINQNFAAGSDYEAMNEAAYKIYPGSEGVQVIPFANGAERMLNNRTVGAHILNLDWNRHEPVHVYRAAQEGVAFAFRYGLDIMRKNGIKPTVIRAGKANMFLSKTFVKAFVNVTACPVELYNSSGSVGAALGAGIGAGVFKTPAEAFANLKPQETVEPLQESIYNDCYQKWKDSLQGIIKMQDAEQHRHEDSAY
jgi:xylulokinase